ncbi:hypothetical protein FGG08_005014 [Glutinoglossum americanum]|uniref:GDP/GTP exchange factor Sec2 N-terminal domain-containing protein n=1 Tax=Glutinoglossum americanum TaxID=1670608 RepID=A0A9P8I176_9PEZI|nr:hypothetical protein FGG08_005014 [Glutinoglossum americanum]
MSLTSASTLSSLSLATAPSPVPAAGPQCPNCGIKLPHSHHQDIPEDAQRRIEELEAQVKILTTKATAAVDKLADYEDELQRLKTTQMTYLSSSPSAAAPPGSIPPDPPSLSARAQNRLSSLLTSRKSSPNLSRDAASPPSSSPDSLSDLQRALTHERSLRAKAEGQLTQAAGELEELSASLFQQANEMVATERRERAKLEARVKVLEERDGEKRVRLERLERAVKRVERVRGLLVGS